MIEGAKGFRKHSTFWRDVLKLMGNVALILETLESLEKQPSTGRHVFVSISRDQSSYGDGLTYSSKSSMSDDIKKIWESNGQQKTKTPEKQMVTKDAQNVGEAIRQKIVLGGKGAGGKERASQTQSEIQRVRLKIGEIISSLPCLSHCLGKARRPVSLTSQSSVS